MVSRKVRKKISSSAAKIAGVGIALQDVTARHGAAVNEWLAAYDGVNYEAGFTPRARMQKSFKSIAKSRVSRDPKVAEANKNQQAGFDAELIEVTQARADAVARGEKPHTLRMDDAGPKGARHSNDQFIDITEVDANGVPIPGSGYQMKFVGKDAKACFKEVLKYEKYYDKNTRVFIPADYYDEVRKYVDKRYVKAKAEVDKRIRMGSPIPEGLQKDLDRCRKVKEYLCKSKTTKAKARKFREDPQGSVKEEVKSQKHRAGIEGAKIGASVAGVLSGISNLLAVARGDKTWKLAAIDTTKDALVAGAGGYFTAAGGAAISGAMMKSSNAVMRAMGRSGFPGSAITFLVSGAATLCKYFNGEIRGSDCMDELANLGTSMAVGSVAYGAVAATSSATALTVGGVALLPMAGAIMASMVASAVFAGLKNWAYKDAYAAEARAQEIEARCTEACRKLAAYKQQIEGYFKTSNSEFCRFMDEALFMIDSENFETSVTGATKIATACGVKALVQNVGDVDSLMSCPFKIGRG